ncbi:uncharacterized protein MYCFIDRAFT_196152 [Pseudocercospora fijiensis CIRAD86]|uniref:Uncharacterized protein n=1 Tax=Pseudocercospora fijiensis (strain CIRAD86) TaxID=383855 RepID=M2YYB4_PSEFD|nr:uncharacterized protein MYCFIDRAFT_196152 [Pseudocercospora fijiensis CIRAD86]EME82640.1 hypothetical protein MYCFIDRAFT_196152 [Pseudocercospora fijiensis CIRAD86]
MAFEDMDRETKTPTDLQTHGFLYDFDKVARSLIFSHSFLPDFSGSGHGQEINLPVPPNGNHSEMKKRDITNRRSTAVVLYETPAYAAERTVHSVFIPVIVCGWRCITEDFENVCQRVHHELQLCYLYSVLEPQSALDIRKEILQAFWHIERHYGGDTWRGKVQTPDNETYSAVAFDMSFFNREEHVLDPNLPYGPAWECHMGARSRDSQEWSEIGRYQAKWNAKTDKLDCKMVENPAFQVVPQKDSCYLVAEALEELRGMDEEGEELVPLLRRFSLQSLEWCQPRYRTQWEILENVLISFCGGNPKTAEWLRDDARKKKAEKARNREVGSALAEELE